MEFQTFRTSPEAAPILCLILWPHLRMGDFVISFSSSIPNQIGGKSEEDDSHSNYIWSGLEVFVLEKSLWLLQVLM